MPDSAVSEQPERRSDKPNNQSESEAFRKESVPSQEGNNSFKEAVSSSLETAKKTVNDIFGRMTITGAEEKGSGVEGSENKTKGPEAKEEKSREPKESVFPPAKGENSPELELVKKEINEQARDPKGAILDAAKNNRVVGLGEMHVEPNGLRTLTESMAPLLSASGVTHLAVEVHHDHQNLLDGVGKNDPEAIKKLQNIYSGLHNNDIRMMQALAKEGIKLTAVDGGFNPETRPRTGVPSTAQEIEEKMPARNHEMASRIGDIVESDPKAKVLALFGGSHLNSSYDSAGQQLKERAKEKGYSVATFGSSESLPDSSKKLNGLSIAEQVNKPVSVETAKTDSLKEVPHVVDKDFKKEPLGGYDHALFFPERSALDTATQLHGEKSPKIVPDIEDLAKKYNSEGRKDEAATLLNRALDIEKQAFGSDSSQVADRHKMMSRQATGDESLKHLEENFSIREKLSGGKSNPELLDATQLLAEHHLNAGNMDEASKYVKKGSESFGNNENKQADSSNLSWGGTVDKTVEALVNKGNLEQSADVLNTDIEHREDARNSMVSQSKLASIYEKLGQPELGEIHREAALDHADSGFQKFVGHAGLAENMLAQNRPEDAEKHFKQAISIMDKEGGLAAATANPLLEKYARFLKDQGRENEADAVLGRRKKGRSSVSLDSITRPEH